MEPALTGGSRSTARRHHCELWELSRVLSILGGTTEIQKEIIARGVGL
jgi:alkylation response protein AidB-like acyl-CoA dehydrogenase